MKATFAYNVHNLHYATTENPPKQGATPARCPPKKRPWSVINRREIPCGGMELRISTIFIAPMYLRVISCDYLIIRSNYMLIMGNKG